MKGAVGRGFGAGQRGFCGVFVCLCLNLELKEKCLIFQCPNPPARPENRGPMWCEERSSTWRTGGLKGSWAPCSGSLAGAVFGVHWSVADVPQPHKNPSSGSRMGAARGAWPARMSPGECRILGLCSAPLHGRQLKWAISYQGKLSLLLSADGANILQSNFT